MPPIKNPHTTPGSLVDLIASCHYDPLKFVTIAYPWGEKGPLVQYPDGPDTWQAEFLIEWGEEIKKRNFNGVDAVAPIRMTRASGHGAGKATAKSVHIHTPDGCVEWGQLMAGDDLFGAGGRRTRILAVHEQGTVPVYKVKFDDNSVVYCTLDHLWNVRGRQERRKKVDTWRTLSTEQILELGVQRKNGVAMAKQWEIPIQEAVQYDGREIDIDPYFMGVWLGDGHRGQPSYGKPYPELVNRLREKGMRVSESPDGITKRILGISHLLTDPVFQVACDEKYIPDDYKYNSIDNRMELLRGLLDTDGEANHSGSCGYSTTSKMLALDVIWLVRSLGGKAMMQDAVKHGWYPDKDGKRIWCNLCYRVTINIDWNPFTLEHRRVAYKPSEHRYIARWIESIEYDHDEDCMCVTVDAPDGLYLTNDFIVTHNSIMSAWITDFIMSTRPNCRGTVTANTFGQLETKTWAAIQKWTNFCITKSWFEITGQIMYRKGAREEWFTAAMSCAEENAQAFAGQHAADSTSFYVVDEGSNVPDAIYNVADGGMTDGEPMIFVFGNPTRSSGKFYRINFGEERSRWKHKTVDSRTCRYTNKYLLKEWEEDWGQDSDRFRVQVKGLPPSASDLQFISAPLVAGAQRRQVTTLSNDPVICGLDVARGGADNCVFRFRRGLDARTIPAIRITGDDAKDSMVLENKALDILKNGAPYQIGDDHYRAKVDYFFVDGTGVGGPVCDHLKALGFSDRVMEIQFGWDAPNTQGFQMCANMRSWMWELLRSWLAKGAIDASSDLESDLLGPMFHYHPTSGELILESKEAMKKRRGTIAISGSPDDGDALALTFARPVAPKIGREQADDEQDEQETGFQYGGGRGRPWG